MDIKLETTLERDVDLLIIEEFISDRAFADIFLSTAELSGSYSVLQAIHSKTDAKYGESDIVFILQIGQKRHALHIEDKISAIAMQDQSARYIKRAEKDVANGEYDTYSILITAPQKYLQTNSEAKKYAYQVPYERMQAHFKAKADARSNYKLAVIERAISEQEHGYQWEANAHVVRFCESMYAYQKQHFPALPTGTVAWWPIYKTYVKNVEIWFKANKGYCDLCFTRTSAYDLYQAVKDKLPRGMTVEQTGRSSAIRIAVTPVNFEDSFESVKGDVHKALEAISTLFELAHFLNENR